MLTGRTKLKIIIGAPIDHIRALGILNPLYAARGIDALAVGLHVPPGSLSEIMRALSRCPNVAGLGVTIPHKENAARLCDELGPNARLTGAVNNVRFGPDGRMTGEMFDGIGLVGGAAECGIQLHGRRAVLLGAGGAARAIAFAIASEGLSGLDIVNRNPRRASDLAAAVEAAFPAVEATANVGNIAAADLVINATSLGMHAGDPMPIDVTLLRPGLDVIDIVTARDTELLLAARERGCRAMGGAPMFRHQIEAQLEFLGFTSAVAAPAQQDR